MLEVEVLEVEVLELVVVTQAVLLIFVMIAVAENQVGVMNVQFMVKVKPIDDIIDTTYIIAHCIIRMCSLPPYVYKKR